MFNLFKSKKQVEYRVVEWQGKYIPQIKIKGQWFGVTKDASIWIGTDYCVKYCSFDTYKEAINIAVSYVRAFT